MSTKQPGEAPASLLETLASDASLLSSWQRVRRNRGAPGVDGEIIKAFESHLSERLPLIQSDLLSGTFLPQPVRALDVAKPSGGFRTLGIPTVTDRLVLDALAHMIGPFWETSFSPCSFGFRPGLGAHDAVAAAQRLLQQGQAWVVDLDIEKFFDHVDHRRLMLRLGQRVTDPRVLDLIGDCLRAGLSRDGVLQPTRVGIAQGSPLSPLLANIVLDELDQEFARQGWPFVRYADDCILFARTEADGRKILGHTADFLRTRLHLNLHPQKSRVVQPEQADHLGFTYRIGRYGRVRRKVTSASLGNFREHVAQLTQAAPGSQFEDVVAKVGAFVRGWSNYYGFSEDNTLAAARSFARSRLRAFVWTMWATPEERLRQLLRLGVSAQQAETAACGLHLPDEFPALPVLALALPNAWFEPFGLGEKAPHVSVRKPLSPVPPDYLRDHVLSAHLQVLASALTAPDMAGKDSAVAAMDALLRLYGHLQALLGRELLRGLSVPSPQGPESASRSTAQTRT